MKCRSKVAIAVSALVGTSLLISSLAQADAPTPFQVLKGLPQVSDSELAHMRGRYITPNQVVYFGVQMETRWQTKDGRIIGAWADFGLPMPGNGSNAGPTLNVRACIDAQCSSTGNGSQSSGGGQFVFSLPASAGGLNTASGVVQSIQVAANRNTVNNSIQLDVTTMGSNTGTGGFLLDGDGANASQSDNNGTVVAASVGKGGLGVSATLPGQQQIVQYINDGNVMQSTFVNTDMNMIQNTIHLNIGVQNAGAGIGTANVGAALQTLNGIPTMGLR